MPRNAQKSRRLKLFSREQFHFLVVRYVCISLSSLLLRLNRLFARKNFLQWQNEWIYRPGNTIWFGKAFSILVLLKWNSCIFYEVQIWIDVQTPIPITSSIARQHDYMIQDILNYFDSDKSLPWNWLCVVQGWMWKQKSIVIKFIIFISKKKIRSTQNCHQ